MATFADDTAILTVRISIDESTNNLQRALNKVVQWTRKWRILLDEGNSVHVNFTNRREGYLPIFIDENQVPFFNTANYLGLTVDAKLRWKENVEKKKIGVHFQEYKITDYNFFHS